MKTITLPELLNFSDALQSLLDGKCLGIRPDSGENHGFVELHRPHYQREDWLLRWDKGGSDIRTNQYAGKWCLVIADHREFTKITVTEP